MAQELVSEVQASRPLLPRQPEVNIGTSGHVDHGKCQRGDQYVLLNGIPVTGYEIMQSVRSTGVLVSRVGGGEYYRFDDNEVVSLNSRMEPVKARSLFYAEHYSGPMYTVRGKTGRTLSVTPEHPLLINRDGIVGWIKAKDIRANDYAAFLSEVPLEEGLEFRDPLPALREIYQVVTWDDYQRLRLTTSDFTNMGGLSVNQFEKMRMLVGLSKGRLAKLAKIDERTYRRIVREGKNWTFAGKEKVVTALRSVAPVRLSPNEFLVEQRTSAMRRIRKLNDIETADLDLVKWFAFVWSEGSSGRSFVDVTQTVQIAMLEEFLRITKEKLGIEVKSYPKGRFRIYNTPFVDYLHFKFDFNPGNESTCGVASWVCRLPRTLKAVFLRWFFTLDGEFDIHSGQIALSQLNERNLVIISYLLHSFGITPRFSVKKSPTQKGVKIYHRIIVSGRKDLQLFADVIGFEDSRVQWKLVSYLSKIKRASKQTDLSLPIDVRTLQVLLKHTGLHREGLTPVTALTRAKDSSWYKAYEGALRTGRISRTKLLEIVGAVEKHLSAIEQSLRTMPLDGGRLRRHMALCGLPLQTQADELGFSRKKLTRMLRDGSRAELRDVRRHVRIETQRMLHHSKRVLDQLRILAGSPVEFDRIIAVTQEPYDGLVFDLTVPKYANFIAGKGAIICHNTTLTQAITGIWASAHSEELKRGITIKVGYADAAFYKCTQDHGVGSYSTSAKCPVDGRKTTFLRAVSFVDTPGHESLMTNMLAGAFLMDGALLVIAANEAVPKPQTREHLQALQMLGMKRIVIAQNKVDLVTDAEAEKNHTQIEKFVEGTIAEGAPIVPISAQQRLNIDALIEAIEVVIPTPKRDANAKPLMYVVRSFDVNRPGTEIMALSGGVLGGSLTRGELRVGDEIELKPGMIDERSGKFVSVITKVSSLQTGAGATNKVGPGGLVAVGTHLDPTFIKGDQMVGSVIGRPGTLPETLEHITLDVKLLETAVGAAEIVKVDKVKLGETVRLNLGTASTLAGATSVRGEVVELDLKKPVAIESGMRAAISRRIAERWRLIGSGVLK